MRYLIACLFAVLIHGWALAQPRSLEQAKAMATHYLDNKFSEPLPYNLSNAYEIGVKSMANNGNFSPVYFFKDTLSQQLVLVSGDERMEPILGVCTLPPTSDIKEPPALRDLIYQFAREYDFLQNQPFIKVANPRETLTAPDVAPLLSTSWGQGSPYNDLCPRNYASGCVATAMAQIINNARYPIHGFGARTYTSATNRIPLSYNFGQAVFDWENMKDSYDIKATNAQREAVAELMFACGVAVSMDYGMDQSGQSGAYSFDVPYALIHYFGYNPNVVYLQRDYYSNEEWRQRLYAELTAGRPVFYSGSNSLSGGHAFVIEGCRSSDNKVYVNWGWDGNYDGYYSLSSLNPSQYRFSTNQSMVAQISPNLVGIHEDVFYAEKFEINGTLKGGASLNGLLTQIECMANTASYTDPSGRFTGNVGIGLFDEHLNFITSLVEKPMADLAIEEIRGVKKYPFVLDIAGYPDGTYHIAPYAQSIDSKLPTRIRTSGGASDMIDFCLENGMINGEPPENNPVVPNNNDILWSEDFEALILPQSFSQNSLQGTGLWEARIVHYSLSDQMPMAAHGTGYAYMKSKAQSMNGMRDVCQLITEEITTTGENSYILSFSLRKYSAKIDSNDALNVLIYTDEDGWSQLYETSIVTSSSWAPFLISLPKNIKAFRLCFEGSAGSGATLFLDNIVISKKNEEDYIAMPKGSRFNVESLFYSFSGLDLPRISRGLNIIRQPDGTVRKVLIK